MKTDLRSNTIDLACRAALDLPDRIDQRLSMFVSGLFYVVPPWQIVTVSSVHSNLPVRLLIFLRTISILISRIRLIDQVKPRIQRLTIFQRLGSRNTLIHKWTIAKTPKKNSHSETMATNLIHRMTHLLSHQTEAPNVLNVKLLNLQRTKKRAY